MADLSKSNLVFLLLLINVILVSVSTAEEYFAYDKEHFPNPLITPHYCKRTKPSQFCDPDSLLSKQQGNKIDELIKKMENDTGCICDPSCPADKNGLKVGVAMMKSTKSNSEEFLQDYADYLRKNWKLGTCKDDILLLIIASHGKIVASLGDNTAAALSKKEFDDIHRKAEKHFRNKDYFRGLVDVLQSYYDTIKAKNLDKDSVKSAMPSLILLIVIAFAAFILLICFAGFICYVRRKCKSRKHKDDDVETNSVGMLKRNFGGARDVYNVRSNESKDMCYNEKTGIYTIQCDKDSAVDRERHSSGRGESDMSGTDEGSSEEEDDQSEVYNRPLPTPPPIKSKTPDFKTDKRS